MPVAEKPRPVIAMALQAVKCPCCGEEVVLEVRASAATMKKVNVNARSD